MIFTYFSSPFSSPTGSIFHVRVHTAQKGLEHALLYSIGVNLPAHRVGQLDRVLVLASPINDINIHAWDLNRVKRFMQLDVGVQMELCSSCMISQTQGVSITFILDKLFHEECIEFLCNEARISTQPVKDNSLLVYPVNHKCTRPLLSLENPSPQPPSYAESQQNVEERQIPRTVYHDTPPELPPRNKLYVCKSTVQGINSTSTGSSASTSGIDNWGSDFVPPRNITRNNYETAIPAVAHPYTNFQPHLFQQSSSSFESPYQISSRIIITNSGEVQYERNILGNKPRHHGGFHFKQDMPLPPRASTTTKFRSHVNPRFPSNKRPHSSPPFRRRLSDPQLSHFKMEKRASELSECEDSYIVIPDLVLDPSRRSPQLPHTAAESPDHLCTSPRLMGNEMATDANLLSCEDVDDYDDVVITSNISQVCMTHGRATPQVVTTWERTDNLGSHVPPPLDHSTIQPTHLQLRSPPKPAVKPRRLKPTSELKYPSDDDDSSSARKASNVHVKKTHSIHRNPPSFLHSSEMPRSTSRDSLNNHTSGDTSSPTMGRKYLHNSTEDISVGTLLTHLPLTPPIPKRRSGLRVKFADHLPHTEDDSHVGRTSALSVRVRQSHSLSTHVRIPPQEMLMSDV